MGRIKAIITDFDGTLVDTLMANYLAYREAFESFDYQLSLDEYKQCYGLRFDAFCDKMNIKQDDRKPIKELKKKIYPAYFSHIRLNESLLRFIKSAKQMTYKKVNDILMRNFIVYLDIFLLNLILILL